MAKAKTTAAKKPAAAKTAKTAKSDYKPLTKTQILQAISEETSVSKKDVDAVLAALTLIRLAKGPTAADRMVAGDAADTLICCAMVLFALFSGRGIYLDIALVAALFGVIDTMLVGRYLEKERGKDQ